MLKKQLTSLVLAAFSSVGTLFAAPFGSGNLVVYRVGNGTTGLVNSGSPIFLDEYSPAGNLIQSIPLPTSGANALIASGTATSEGLISRSGDGQYLAVTGYNRALGGSGSLVNTNSTTVNRAIALVGADGTVSSTTKLSDWASGNNPRSAVTLNGSQLWVAGASGGVRYVPTLTNTTSTQINLPASLTNVRSIAIFGGQLFVSNDSDTANNTTSLGHFSTALPTTSSNYTALPGFPPVASLSLFSFLMLDMDGSPGLDTIYIADDSARAVTKYAFVGGSWISKGTVGTDADDYRGITGAVSGNTVTIYATRSGGSASSGGGQLVSFQDPSGFNGALPGNTTVTVLAPASLNRAFRGVALTPQSATPTAMTFSQWLVSHGLPATGQFTDDSDGNGIIDLIEYSFALDPTDPNDPDHLPRVVRGAGDQWELQYTLSDLAVYPGKVRKSSDMAVYVDAVLNVDYESIGTVDHGDSTAYRFRILNTSLPRLFFIYEIDTSRQ